MTGVVGATPDGTADVALVPFRGASGEVGVIVPLTLIVVGIEVGAVPEAVGVVEFVPFNGVAGVVGKDGEVGTKVPLRPEPGNVGMNPGLEMVELVTFRGVEGVVTLAGKVGKEPGVGIVVFKGIEIGTVEGPDVELVPYDGAVVLATVGKAGEYVPLRPAPGKVGVMPGASLLVAFVPLKDGNDVDKDTVGEAGTVDGSVRVPLVGISGEELGPDVLPNDVRLVGTLGDKVPGPVAGSVVVVALVAFEGKAGKEEVDGRAVPLRPAPENVGANGGKLVSVSLDVGIDDNGLVKFATGPVGKAEDAGLVTFPLNTVEGAPGVELGKVPLYNGEVLGGYVIVAEVREIDPLIAIVVTDSVVGRVPVPTGVVGINDPLRGALEKVAVSVVDGKESVKVRELPVGAPYEAGGVKYGKVEVTLNEDVGCDPFLPSPGKGKLIDGDSEGVPIELVVSVGTE